MKGKVKGRRKVGLIVLAAAILLIVLFFDTIVSFVTDYWWFKDLNYTQVFFKKLFTEIKIAVPSFIVMTVLSEVYLHSLKKSYLKKVDTAEGKISDLTIRRLTVLAGIVLSGILTFIITTSLWKQILYFSSSTQFGESDPIFGLDISFYVFKLIFFNSVVSIAFFMVFLFAIATLLFFTFLMSVRSPQGLREEDVYEAEPVGSSSAEFIRAGLKNKGVSVNAGSARTLLSISSRHITILAVLFFLLMGVSYILKQFDLLYTDSGTVFGAGFTASLITMNGYRIEAALAVIAAIATVIFVKKKQYKKLLYVPACMIAVMILSGALGAAVQSLIVSPDELNRETPYLERNIKYTQKAYGLDEVATKSFDADGTLTGENIQNNQSTISNIRINDFQPSKQFYNQTQAIRTYYSFNDVDVDRYMIDDQYTQTFLSVREMDIDNMGDVSWLTKHLKYTHGYGLTLSRVDAVTESGQPEMLVDNIPPQSNTQSLKIENPAIYYGEKTDDYVITNTDEKEFDYPSGDENKYTKYNGSRGITLSPLRRLMYAVKEKNIRILISSNINSNSKILYDRNIEKRVQKIAPFLDFDTDPYIVISDSGQLYWMIDAYTTTSKYPYSETSTLSGGQVVNYVRNPVKVTVNAYDGTVDFYKVSDEPIIDTIAKIYPGLIKDASEMPDGLNQHIRYSNTLFSIQTKTYQKYHMSNVNVFYQKEDKWDIATEVYGQKETEITPNYYIMKLPGEENEEFISSIQFTPSGKRNLTGIMVAQCDGDNYGNLILYKLPKDKTIYGPMQIESQIDQNTEISKEFSLWNSSGSTYTRGEMFVIPIDESLLYVEPIYLESDTESSLPEVKRVIVAYKDQIAYGSTLSESLSSLFDMDGYNAGESSSSGTTGASDDKKESGSSSAGSKSVQELAALAAQAYDNSQNALSAGNWAKYGEYQSELKGYLDQLAEGEAKSTAAEKSAAPASADEAA